MGWLILVLVVVLILGVAAIAAPTVFGPLASGLAPLLLVVALIGLGAVWWRHAQGRVDPAGRQEESAPAANSDSDVQGENERVET